MDAKKVPLLEEQIRVLEQARSYADSIILSQSHTIYLLKEQNNNLSTQINLYMENEKDYKKIIKRQSIQKWVDRSLNIALVGTVVGLGFK